MDRLNVCDRFDCNSNGGREGTCMLYSELADGPKLHVSSSKQQWHNDQAYHSNSPSDDVREYDGCDKVDNH
uniref:Uncharacterized protein n=1 Tax=Tanacetum cinerariifolium TaxID=118510 RepID=A0A699X530_TANCI|nr:hypothetical protein [Tanacetum cinerariifolium]